jgi:tetratricopeptide (TPR) repeat protein
VSPPPPRPPSRPPSRPMSRNMRRARAALDRGNWLLAVNLLRDGLAGAPEDFGCAVLLAHIYLEQGRYALAEVVVDTAFSWAHVEDPETVCPVTPEQRELFVMKANLRLAHGDPEGALTLYVLLMGEAPHDPDLAYHAGLAYESMCQHDLAISYFDRAVQADPGHLPAREIKGQILFGLGRLAEALDLYTEITLGHPDNVNAFVMMGRIYERLRRPVAAVYAWERAVSLAPNADEPLRMLGHAALRGGDIAQARSYLTRAVAANPNNVMAHLDLADLLADLGETCAAVGHWDEAERLCPGHPRLAHCRERREAVTRQVATWSFPKRLPTGLPVDPPEGLSGTGGGRREPGGRDSGPGS